MVEVSKCLESEDRETPVINKTEKIREKEDKDEGKAIIVPHFLILYSPSELNRYVLKFLVVRTLSLFTGDSQKEFLYYYYY